MVDSTALCQVESNNSSDSHKETKSYTPTTTPTILETAGMPGRNDINQSISSDAFDFFLKKKKMDNSKRKVRVSKM